MIHVGSMLAAALAVGLYSAAAAAEQTPDVTFEAGVRVVRLMPPAGESGDTGIDAHAARGPAEIHTAPGGRGPRIIFLREREDGSVSAADRGVSGVDAAGPPRFQDRRQIIKDPYAPSRARHR